MGARHKERSSLDGHTKRSRWKAGVKRKPAVEDVYDSRVPETVSFKQHEVDPGSLMDCRLKLEAPPLI